MDTDVIDKESTIDYNKQKRTNVSLLISAPPASQPIHVCSMEEIRRHMRDRASFCLVVSLITEPACDQTEIKDCGEGERQAGGREP